MPLFVVVLLKGKSCNKGTKREAENKRRENKRSQNRDKKVITADSTPDSIVPLLTKVVQQRFKMSDSNNKKSIYYSFIFLFLIIIKQFNTKIINIKKIKKRSSTTSDVKTCI